jgi:hypothetical protein
MPRTSAATKETTSNTEKPIRKSNAKSPITKRDTPKRAAKTASSAKSAAGAKKTKRGPKKGKKAASRTTLTASDVVGKKFSIGHFGLLVDIDKYTTMVSQDGLQRETPFGSLVGSIPQVQEAITTKKNYMEKFSTVGPYGLHFYHEYNVIEEETPTEEPKEEPVDVEMEKEEGDEAKAENSQEEEKEEQVDEDAVVPKGKNGKQQKKPKNAKDGDVEVTY